MLGVVVAVGEDEVELIEAVIDPEGLSDGGGGGDVAGEALADDDELFEGSELEEGEVEGNRHVEGGIANDIEVDGEGLDGVKRLV